ncbi:MAG TPA: MBL fold metallo-hydrolase [Vicinamibacterales bacterium]|nr:MBL fold metallo-hydrolase [Vicinamibacterales bacterium]
MRMALVVAAGLLSGVVALRAQAQDRTLDIYFIDTEGGQSTLYVGPTGETLLVDTGNAGDRDLGRIVETLKVAGVQRIDHLWTTHYHGDHVGSLLALAAQVPIAHFYDHGAPHPDDRIVSVAFMSSYENLTRGRRTVVAPGDTIRMRGLEITVVASADRYLRTNLRGGGRPNAACAVTPPKDESGYRDPDNGHSAGFVMAYGRFRTINLGDLTWNGEIDLMCPTNRIGAVDVYLTSHHGLAASGSPALVHALQPRVAVMNNGTRKGGAPEAFRVLHESPGLEDVWQLHWSHNAGLDNAPAMFVANVDDAATVAGVLTGPAAGAAGRQGGAGAPGGAAAHTPAYLIVMSARPDGTFTVTNTRNGFRKTYRPRN